MSARSYADENEAIAPWNEFSPEQSDGIGIIKYMVCAYCRNRMRQRCIEVCAPEGLYRNLEPKELDTWQESPKLPSMAEIMEYAPVSRLAFIYLVLRYMSIQED